MTEVIPHKDWKVLAVKASGLRHLGSSESGRRTACGQLLVSGHYQRLPPGEITCKRCKRTWEYKRAVSDGVITRVGEPWEVE